MWAPGGRNTLGAKRRAKRLLGDVIDVIFDKRLDLPVLMVLMASSHQASHRARGRDQSHTMKISGLILRPSFATLVTKLVKWDYATIFLDPA